MPPRARAEEVPEIFRAAPLFFDAEAEVEMEPGAPDERVTAPDNHRESKLDGKQSKERNIPDAAGGFVKLLLVSMYASVIGLFKHSTTGLIVKF